MSAPRAKFRSPRRGLTREDPVTSVRTLRGRWLCALASLVAACGGDASSPPTTPTVVAPSSPLTPGPNSPSPVSGQFTITGIVQGSERPIPGVNVNAWVQETGGFGYSWWWAHGPLHADAAGRCVISGLPTSAHAWLQAFQPGY